MDNGPSTSTGAAPIDRLIFIYNADGGIAQGIMDSVHKTLSPATYACSLCAVTHGVFTMNAKWRAWLKGLAIPTKFYHRDDSPYRVALPAVLAMRDGTVETVISAERLTALADVDALIAELEAQLG